MIEVPNSIENPTVNKPPNQDIEQTMKKNKSIDDFMKHHVPWIL